MTPINIKSDTQTLPTPRMLEAISQAQLGDDTYGEDPNVKQLEAMAADMMGKEAGLLAISGSMANLIALMAHAKHGDEVLLDPESHIFYYEVGGMANIAGLMPMPVHAENGMMDPDTLAKAIRKKNLHYPRPRLLCLENPHNRASGRVIAPDRFEALCNVAREHGLAIHLDGARIFNAALAAGVQPTEFTKHVDSVMFCLSKSLSCPLGSVLSGSATFIEEADFQRKRLGGGMRQAGVIAAPGVVALTEMIDRLVEDHDNARHLAELINATPGLSVDMSSVQTNMVYVNHEGTGLSTGDLLARLKEHGVIASGRPPSNFRMVVSRHQDREVVEEVAKRIRQALVAVAS